MIKVMFVCHGNICRSPMAEFIMKKLVADKKEFLIESKAVSAEEIGNPIYPKAAETLRRHGVPFGRHCARQMVKNDYDVFDYIVVMESYNLPRLFRIIGDDPEGKVYRLLDFTGNPGDIEDPWYSGKFDTVYNQIEVGCKALLKRLLQKNHRAS